MRKWWVIGVAAICAASCSTSAQLKTAAKEAAPTPSYQQAVETLIAATRTKDEFQSTTMNQEGAPCRFGFYISPGRQSTLGFLFDVRQLDLSTVSASTGQASVSPFSRRIACAKQHGFCASNTGMPVPFVDIAAPTAQDLERAMTALRQLQATCGKTAGAP